MTDVANDDASVVQRECKGAAHELSIDEALAVLEAVTRLRIEELSGEPA